MSTEAGQLHLLRMKGRHWRDLRLGWCVDHDALIGLDPTSRLAWRALAAASHVGERLVDTTELARFLQHDPHELEAVLSEMFARRRTHHTPIVRVGPTGRRRWTAYARAGRVDRPLQPSARAAIEAVLGEHAPARAVAVRSGPETWWQYGGWLRLTAAAVAAGEVPPSLLALPSGDLDALFG